MILSTIRPSELPPLHQPPEYEPRLREPLLLREPEREPPPPPRRREVLPAVATRRAELHRSPVQWQKVPVAFVMPSSGRSMPVGVVVVQSFSVIVPHVRITPVAHCPSTAANKAKKTCYHETAQHHHHYHHCVNVSITN